MFEVEKWLHSRIGLNFRSGLGRMQRAVDLLRGILRRLLSYYPRNRYQR